MFATQATYEVDLGELRVLPKIPKILKSDNLARWVDGMNDSSTKHLMFQALFFFIISYRLRALKTLYFYFCKIIKRIRK